MTSPWQHLCSVALQAQDALAGPRLLQLHSICDFDLGFPPSSSGRDTVGTQQLGLVAIRLGHIVKLQQCPLMALCSEVAHGARVSG